MYREGLERIDDGPGQCGNIRVVNNMCCNNDENNRGFGKFLVGFFALLHQFGCEFS